MSKSIVFLFSHSEAELIYRDSYLAFAEFAAKQGVVINFVFGLEYLHGDTFSTYWTGERDVFIKHTQSITPGIIYLRDRMYLPNRLRRVNNSVIEEACRDKLLTYNTFSEFIKFTTVLTPDTLDHITTEKVVIKPRFGANGSDVAVIDKNNIVTHDVSKKEYIIQEFIDSSDGIEGLVGTRHELRIFVFNGIVSAAYIRIPAKDSYLSNISQGATEMQFPLDKLPNSAHEVVREVDMKFSMVSPRIYTIDLMYENNRPWIVELNDNPGMPDTAVQPFTQDYFSALLKFLSSQIKN